MRNGNLNPAKERHFPWERAYSRAPFRSLPEAEESPRALEGQNPERGFQHPFPPQEQRTLPDSRQFPPRQRP